jgi:hypothetical protein
VGEEILMSLHKNVVDWEDSAALEAFNDAKARFCDVYHGQHCDIPLPDPDMFIDIVNPDEYVDPIKDNGIPDVWDSFIFSDKPVPVTGWGCLRMPVSLRGGGGELGNLKS